MSLIDNIYHGTYATMPNAKEAEKKITGKRNEREM